MYKVFLAQLSGWSGEEEKTRFHFLAKTEKLHVEQEWTQHGEKESESERLWSYFSILT